MNTKEILASTELTISNKLMIIGSWWMIIASIIAVLFGGNLLIYWQFFDNPTTIVENTEPRIITPGPYHPGQTVYIERDYCQYRVPDHAERYIINTFTYRIQYDAVGTKIGCSKTVTSIPIPGDVFHKGIHNYAVTVFYNINPLKTKAVKLKEVSLLIE